MSPVSARVVLFATSVLLLLACAPKTVKQSGMDAEPPRDEFTQQGGAQPTPTADQPTATATNPAPGATAGAGSGSSAWPIVLTSESTTFEVHEPIVDSWDSGILTGRALVLAQPPLPAQSVAGSVTIKALTEVDSSAGTVSLVNTEVLGVSFPDGVDTTQAWHEFLRFAVPPKMTALPLAALESGRGIAQARQNAATAEVAAPRIIVSERPAMLVYIDGSPRFVTVRRTNLMGVLNTRVLLLKESAGTYYLHLYNGWVTASSLDGPWTIAPRPPDAPGLEQAARASGRVNLLLGKADAYGNTPQLFADHLPDIVVALQPTALIVLDGPPRYASLAGTSLLHAVNTSAHLFRVTALGDVYVHVDNNWFRSADVSGPWSHVPAASLPPEFAPISGLSSTSHPNVVVADRRTAMLSVNMDGDPVLQPIAGTSLSYVANASVPVIQIDIDNWYAVQDGVWFYSTRATGPWTVTTSVPAAIYSIPPNVPIYHAIHSRVIASSTDVTYYGYPGAGSLAPEGGAVGVEEQGADYQYTPPSGMYWGWFY